jgi:hypothetical protein
MTVDGLASRFRGATVVCAASGPSLAAADLDQVRAAGLPLVVVNDTWRMAPWADVLVAMDTAWWRVHGAEVAAQFCGATVGWTAQAPKFGAQFTAWASGMHNFGNSGAAAIALLARGRAACALLLGYDARAGEGGALHWHADHAAPLSNPQLSLGRWPKQFERVAAHAKQAGLRVINCSRRTALRCFERATLEEALRSTPNRSASGSSMSAASGGSPPAPPPSGSAIAPGP